MNFFVSTLVDSGICTLKFGSGNEQSIHNFKILSNFIN
jgi:hypothetical protein